MKFSIITATYNSEKTLQKTIDSILNQSVQEFQYIIVDGQSTDDTIKIIKENCNKFKTHNIEFTWISEKDTGIYNAWNKGLTLANGDWVSFLGSDDWYLQNAIETYRSAIMVQSRPLDLLYSNVNLIKGEKCLKQINGRWSWRIFKKYMNIAHVGAFHNTTYFKTFGNFNEDYKIAGDYELLLRAKGNLKTHKIDFVSAHMTDGGISHKNVNVAFRETFKAKRDTAKLPYLPCMYDFILAWVKVKLKRIRNAYS